MASKPSSGGEPGSSSASKDKKTDKKERRSRPAATITAQSAEKEVLVVVSSPSLIPLPPSPVLPATSSVTTGLGVPRTRSLLTGALSQPEAGGFVRKDEFESRFRALDSTLSSILARLPVPGQSPLPSPKPQAIDGSGQSSSSVQPLLSELQPSGLRSSEGSGASTSGFAPQEYTTEVLASEDQASGEEEGMDWAEASAGSTTHGLATLVSAVEHYFPEAMAELAVDPKSQEWVDGYFGTSQRAPQRRLLLSSKVDESLETAFSVYCSLGSSGSKATGKFPRQAKCALPVEEGRLAAFPATPTASESVCLPKTQGKAALVPYVASTVKQSYLVRQLKASSLLESALKVVVSSVLHPDGTLKEEQDPDLLRSVLRSASLLNSQIMRDAATVLAAEVVGVRDDVLNHHSELSHEQIAQLRSVPPINKEVFTPASRLQMEEAARRQRELHMAQSLEAALKRPAQTPPTPQPAKQPKWGRFQQPQQPAPYKGKGRGKVRPVTKSGQRPSGSKPQQGSNPR